MVFSDNPIEIYTLKDALNALRRKQGSFEEWLECSAIFARHSMWGHLEESASRALHSAVNRSIKPTLLAEAAKRFAAGTLGEFNNKSDFEKKCQNTIENLKKIQYIWLQDKKKFHEYINSLTQVLDEILILLSDGSPQALTSIAARLRKRLARPDLAIKVADIALRKDPSVIPGYVTRGSAFTDIGDFSKALSDLEIAEQDNKSRPYAIAAHTRLLIRQGNFKDALTIGQELFLRRISRPLILLMISAAKGANDQVEFERLMRLAESVQDSGKKSGRTLLMRQAVRLLIENRQYETAEKLINDLSKFDRPAQVNALNEMLRRSKKIYLSSGKY